MELTVDDLRAKLEKACDDAVKLGLRIWPDTDEPDQCCPFGALLCAGTSEHPPAQRYPFSFIVQLESGATEDQAAAFMNGFDNRGSFGLFGALGASFRIRALAGEWTP